MVELLQEKALLLQEETAESDTLLPREQPHEELMLSWCAAVRKEDRKLSENLRNRLKIKTSVLFYAKSEMYNPCRKQLKLSRDNSRPSTFLCITGDA